MARILEQKQKAKAAIEVKCKNKCIKKTKNGLEICDKSPCEENLFKFGLHERIFEYYIDNKKYDEAYFYFQDWLPMFVIECKIDDFDKIKNGDLKDLHPGCRIFVISRELKKVRKTLKIYKNLDDPSVKGKVNYLNAKKEFIDKIYSAIELLKHLSMDKKSKAAEQDANQEKLLQLYDIAILAAKKYGIKVGDSELGNALEKGFEKAAQGAGLETEKHAELNKKRTKQAKKEMAINKLMEQMKQELAETGQISQETQEKLEGLRV